MEVPGIEPGSIHPFQLLRSYNHFPLFIRHQSQVLVKVGLLRFIPAQEHNQQKLYPRV